MTRTNTLLNVTALLVVFLLFARPVPAQANQRLEPGAPLVVAVTDQAGMLIDVVHVGHVPAAGTGMLALRLPDLGETGLLYAVHTRVLPADDTTAGPGTEGCFWFGGKAPAWAAHAALLIPMDREGVDTVLVPGRRVRGLEGETTGTPHGQDDTPDDVIVCPWGGWHPDVVPTLGKGPDPVLVDCQWFGGKAPAAAAGTVFLVPADPGGVIVMDPGLRTRGLEGETTGTPYGQDDTPDDPIVCPWGGWRPDVVPTLGTEPGTVLTLGPDAAGRDLQGWPGAAGLDTTATTDTGTEGLTWFPGMAPQGAGTDLHVPTDREGVATMVGDGRRVRDLEGEVAGNGPKPTPYGATITCPWGGWRPDVAPSRGSAPDTVLTIGPKAAGYDVDGRVLTDTPDAPLPGTPPTCQVAPHLARPVTLVPLGEPNTATAPGMGTAPVTVLITDTGLGLDIID